MLGFAILTLSINRFAIQSTLVRDAIIFFIQWSIFQGLSQAIYSESEPNRTVLVIISKEKKEPANRYSMYCKF